MNGWEMIKIKDIVKGFYDGPHATPKESDAGAVFLGIGNIKPEGGIDLSDIRYIAMEDFALWTRRVKPRKNDIVFSYEATLHRYALIPDDLLCCLGRRLALIRVDDTKADFRFIYYTLLSPFWKNQIESRLIAGATVERIPLIEFPNFQLPLPPLPVQRRIAYILGRYDALIANYQQQISTLEGMAQELYREWFVRGRCPHAEPGEDGGLPMGWERKTLGDIAVDARQIVRIEKLNPDTPYVGLEHLSIKSIVIKNSGTVEDVDSDKLLFRESDILFGKIRAYLHKVCISHFDGVCSSDTIVIRPKINHGLGFVLFTVFSDHFIEFADKVSNGTKMPRSEWKALKTYSVVVPTEKDLKVFDEITILVFKKMFNLQTQLTTLQQTRDALLPRLLSGQLSVEEEKFGSANGRE